ncbi:MAG: gliding motility-associated C-terminal domain-containing protein [Mangrovibacterium sp.]
MRKYFTNKKQKKPREGKWKGWTLFPLLLGLTMAGPVMAQNEKVLKEETLYMCRSHLLPVDLGDVIGVAIPAGSGNWYDSSTGQPVGNIFIPEVGKNRYTFYFRVESKAALCELEVGNRYVVNIVINDVPTPTGDPEQLFCYSPADKLSLQDLEVTGDNIFWFSQEQGGIPLDIKTPLVNSTTYYATQLEPGCGESTNRLAVLVKMNIQPNIQIIDPGVQTADYDLAELEVDDLNNAEGTISYHSNMPTDAFDMSNRLGSTLITITQKIIVMKATTNGCFDVEEVRIVIDKTNGCDYEVIVDEISDVSCFSGNDGAISLSVKSNSGDGATFSYLWSNGATTASVEELVAGKYSVIITPDSEGCEAIKDTFWIEEPDVLELVMETIEESAPNARDASATAKVTGGTPGYKYLWNDDLQQRTATAINLGAGEYQVTVTDINGCQISGTALLKAKLFIPDGFSPNGDDINERFVISGLEDYPNAKLEVYSRWNNLVYSKESYGNESKWGADAWWDGRSSGNMRVGDGLLPAANYIYFLRLDPDKSDVHRGIIFINR